MPGPCSGTRPVRALSARPHPIPALPITPVLAHRGDAGHAASPAAGGAAGRAEARCRAAAEAGRRQWAAPPPGTRL